MNYEKKKINGKSKILMIKMTWHYTSLENSACSFYAKVISCLTHLAG